MADLRLTPHVAGQRSTDLDTTNGRASFVTGIEEKAQRIRITLQSQLGESVYKRNGGTPWREIVWAPNATEAGVSAAISAVVRNVTGIRDVLECWTRFDDSTGKRVVRIDGIAIDDDDNQIPFGTEVTSP